MKDVRSVKNQYLGINAHLHSLLQGQKLWGDFHTRHITHLADVMIAQLRPIGYTVGIEESLQLRRIEGAFSEPESDVLIYDSDPQRSFSGFAPVMEQAVPITELLADNELSEKPYRAVAIYDAKFRQGRGIPVAWIELLSPSNKGTSRDADAYYAKRMEMLVRGIVFVEIDYLHETPPTFPKIPSYRPRRRQKNDPDAHPYHIIVLDPRPRLEKGSARLFALHVDTPIPIVPIPLNDDHLLHFDFGVPYRHSFEIGFLGDRVDYGILPLHFERYSPADQTRITARMLAVLEAHQQGIDLETGPFAVKEVKLDEALAAIERLKEASQ